jgi:CheY-like chemotaxis protein
MAPEVLVVEDNPANMRLITFLLKARGYEPRGAANAAEALAALEQSRPALILMDLQLPGMDGYELTRKIKADPAKRDIPIVALTAYAMKGDQEKAIAAGCDGYLTKPIDKAALEQELARFIQRASPTG